MGIFSGGIIVMFVINYFAPSLGNFIIIGALIFAAFWAALFFFQTYRELMRNEY